MGSAEAHESSLEARSSRVKKDRRPDTSLVSPEDSGSITSIVFADARKPPLLLSENARENKVSPTSGGWLRVHAQRRLNHQRTVCAYTTHVWRTPRKLGAVRGRSRCLAMMGMRPCLLDVCFGV